MPAQPIKFEEIVRLLEANARILGVADVDTTAQAAFLRVMNNAADESGQIPDEFFASRVKPAIQRVLILNTPLFALTMHELFSTPRDPDAEKTLNTNVDIASLYKPEVIAPALLTKLMHQLERRSEDDDLQPEKPLAEKLSHAAEALAKSLGGTVKSFGASRFGGIGFKQLEPLVSDRRVSFEALKTIGFLVDAGSISPQEVFELAKREATENQSLQHTQQSIAAANILLSCALRQTEQDQHDTLQIVAGMMFKDERRKVREAIVGTLHAIISDKDNNLTDNNRVMLAEAIANRASDDSEPEYSASGQSAAVKKLIGSRQLYSGLIGNVSLSSALHEAGSSRHAFIRQKVIDYQAAQEGIRQEVERTMRGRRELSAWAKVYAPELK